MCVNTAHKYLTLGYSLNLLEKNGGRCQLDLLQTQSRRRWLITNFRPCHSLARVKSSALGSELYLRQLQVIHKLVYHLPWFPPFSRVVSLGARSTYLPAPLPPLFDIWHRYIYWRPPSTFISVLFAKPPFPSWG